MKLNKIFAIALAALTLTACSDDDEPGVNSNSGVSVSMKESTFVIDENVEYFNVPLQVTGNTNGQVVVTLEVTEGPADDTDPDNPTIPAQEGTDFYVTSRTIRIPAGEAEFGIEVRNEWVQGIVNDDKVFTIKIVKAQGATVGNPAECVVTIRNIDDAYTAMCGQWRFTGRYLFTNAKPIDEDCTLAFETPDPVSEAEYYGQELYGYGLRGRDILYMTFSWAFDEDTQAADMSIVVGTLAATSLLNFGLGNTSDGIPIYGMEVATSRYAQGQVVFGDDIPVTLNQTRDEITVDPEAEYFLMIMPFIYGESSQGSGLVMQNVGYFGGWDNMTFNKL